MTAFEDFTRDTRARKVLLVEQDLYDPVTDTEYVAGEGTPYGRWSTHAYNVAPNDSVFANRSYEPRVKGGFKITRSIINGNRLRGRSVPDAAEISLVNADHGLNGLDSLSAVGRRIVVRLGTPAFGTVADFRAVFTGLTEGISSSRDGRTTEIRPAGLEKQLDRDLMKGRRFYGLGTALRFTASSSQQVLFANSGTFKPTTKLVVEAFVETATAASGVAQAIVSNGDASTAGCWNLYLSPTGRVVFRMRRSSDSANFDAFGPVLSNNTKYRVGCRWDGTTMRVWVDGVDQTSTPATFTGTPKATAQQLAVGSMVNTFYFTGKITDVRVWVDQDRTAEQIYANRFRELDSDDTTGRALYLRTNEGTGTRTWDDHLLLEGTLSGSLGTFPVWDTTKTGGAELADKPWPTSWGQVEHRDAIMIDAVNLWYAVHFREIHAVDGVYEGGKKLIPNKSDTSTGISFDGSRANRPLILSDGSVDFRAYAPGQSVTVSGSASNNKSHLIYKVDEAFGLWIWTVGSVTTEAAGASTILGTAVGTHEYTAFPGEGLFQLENVATLPVTARVRGDAVGGYVDTAPELIARIAEVCGGIDPSDIGTAFDDLAAEFPYTAGYATSLEDENLMVIVDRLAQSLGGNWGFSTATDPELDIVVMQEPDPAPDPADRLDLDPQNILKIEKLETIMPVKQVVANFRRNFRPLQWDELAGEVRDDQTGEGLERIDFLTNPWSQVTNDDQVPGTGTVEEEFPIGEETDVVDCYLVWKRHARTVAQSEFGLYGQKREVFRVLTKLEPYNYEFRRATVVITHPNWGSTEDGKHCRMVAFEGTRTHVTLEVWG